MDGEQLHEELWTLLNVHLAASFQRINTSPCSFTVALVHVVIKPINTRTRVADSFWIVFKKDFNMWKRSNHERPSWAVLAPEASNVPKKEPHLISYIQYFLQHILRVASISPLA
eukprot:scaffold80826_cov61-Attheya_sp.AAC.1